MRIKNVPNVAVLLSACALFWCALIPLNGLSSPTKDEVVAAPTSRDGTIAIDKVVRVSATLPSEQHGEVYIAQNPRNPQQLLACSQILNNDNPNMLTGERDVVYTSVDGGAHWRLGMVSPAAASDPSCAFGSSGSAYFLATIFLPKNQNVIFASQDLRHWTISQSTSFVDKSVLLTGRPGYEFGMEGDATDSKVGKVGHIPGGPVLLESKLGQPNLHIAAFTPDAQGYVSTSTAEYLPSGDIAIADSYARRVSPRDRKRYFQARTSNLPGLPNAEIRYYDISLPSGNVRMRTRVAGDYDHDNRWSTCFPSVAVDRSARSPFFGAIYIAWCDSRLGHSSVLVSGSHDHGRTWSIPLILDHSASYTYVPASFEPTVAVNDAGIVGVFWYDRERHKDGIGWDIAFRASATGGSSWSPQRLVPGATTNWSSVSVNTHNIGMAIFGSSLMTISLGFHIFAFHAGDYSGMIADPKGNFHPLWIDNHAGGVPQLWTTSIAVKEGVHKIIDASLGKKFAPAAYQLPQERVRRPQPPATPGTSDVTRNFSIDSRSLWFDGPKEQLGFTLLFRNRGKSAVNCPLYFRASLTPSGRQPLPIAEVHPLGTGKATGADAVWEIAPCDGRVEPGGQLSLPIVVGITNLRILPITARELRDPYYRAERENLLEWHDLRVETGPE